VDFEGYLLLQNAQGLAHTVARDAPTNWEQLTNETGELIHITGDRQGN
jgi:hypothetical protein